MQCRGSNGYRGNTRGGYRGRRNDYSDNRGYQQRRGGYNDNPYADSGDNMKGGMGNNSYQGYDGGNGPMGNDPGKVRERSRSRSQEKESRMNNF